MSSSKQIIFRVTEEGWAAITEKFSDHPSVGAGGQRQRWGSALLYIGLLEPETSIAAYELWQRALQIASERKDTDLREASLVQQKYESELVEFYEVLQRYGRQDCLLVDVANRVSNLLYYAVQLYAQNGDKKQFDERCSYVCQKTTFPLDLAFSLAVAKYRDRGRRAAKGEKKQRTAEYPAMQRILDNSAFSGNLPAKPLDNDIIK